MSIIDNVLVAIDDNDQTKDSLMKIFSQEKTAILFSALGRLVSRGYVIKKGRGKEQTFSISKDGADEVEDNLNYLQNIIDRDELNPVLISLSIPEKFKVERERLRLLLKGWGFALVKNGLLIGMTDDINKLEAKVNDIKENSSIIFFPLIQLPVEIKNNLAKYWDIKSLKALYGSWVLDTKKMARNLSGDIDVRRVQAKATVYELALIIKKDPKIMESKFVLISGLDEALSVYKGIRKYCYK